MKTITIAAAASLVFAGAAFASAPIRTSKAPAFKPAAAAKTSEAKARLAKGDSFGASSWSTCKLPPLFCPRPKPRA